ncbi:MAG: hypothetical protein ACKPCM_06900, partial [Pseudanabaena sp.]
ADASASLAIIGVLAAITYESFNVNRLILQTAFQETPFNATHSVTIIAGGFAFVIGVPNSVSDSTFPSSFSEDRQFDPNDINFGKYIDSILRDLIDGYPFPNGDFNPNNDFNPNDINTNKGRDSHESWRDWIETYPAANGGFSPNDINFGKDLGDLLLPHIFLSVDGIQFGKVPNQTEHTFRHIDDVGLDREIVQQSIENDLSKAAGELTDGLNKRSVVVDGITLDYSAYKLPDGTVNVGRITPPR